jgi:hypothetical protein
MLYKTPFSALFSTAASNSGGLVVSSSSSASAAAAAAEDRLDTGSIITMTSDERVQIYVPSPQTTPYNTITKQQIEQQQHTSIRQWTTEQGYRYSYDHTCIGGGVKGGSTPPPLATQTKCL